MAIKPGEIYRGHRRARTVITIVAICLAVLLLAVIIIFYSLQRYVVVGADGVYLDLPFFKTEELSEDPVAPGATEPQAGELVVAAPDFTDAEFQRVEGLTEIHAVFLSSENISADGLSAAASGLEAKGANAIVMDMKPKSGKLSWKSEVAMALSYGVSGEAELSDAIKELKEQGIYLTAQISCFVDELMAERNPPMALMKEDKSPYSDDMGHWLDPYNRELRDYIFSLIQELGLLGFDEILLTNLSHPHAQGLFYEQSTALEAGISACISNFASAAVERFSETGPRVSVMLDPVSLREGQSEISGQDVTSLSKLFDRLYCQTSRETLEVDLELACAGMDEAHRGLRFVAVMQSAADTGSWLIA